MLIREANEQLVGSFLREHEAHEAADLRFLRLVEGLDAIVWEADATTGQFTYVSPKARIMLGYPLERWLLEPNFWISVIHPEDREQTLHRYRATLAAREDYQADFRAVALDGHEVWIAQKARVNPASSQILGFMVDMTERKRSEETLREALKRHQAMEATLSEKLEELERFHDLVVGRELKMMNLEREVEHLKRQVKSFEAERDLPRLPDR